MNYAGQLAFLDKLFGTMYMPRADYQPSTAWMTQVPTPYILHIAVPVQTAEAGRASPSVC